MGMYVERCVDVHGDERVGARARADMRAGVSADISLGADKCGVTSTDTSTDDHIV